MLVFAEAEPHVREDTVDWCILRRSAFLTFVYAHTHTCMHATESTYTRAQAWQQQQEKAEGAAEQSDKLKEGWRVLVQGRRMGSRGVTSVPA